MSKPRYTILTHECRGRIEPARYMLELKGVPYDEVIVNDANQDQMKRGLLEGFGPFFQIVLYKF